LAVAYADACALSEMIRTKVPVEIRGEIDPRTGAGFDLLGESLVAAERVLDAIDIARELYPLPSPQIDPMKVN
jgi:hypothetical protein